MRAMGLGACSGMARIGAIVTPFVAQVLLKESSFAAISLYGVMCLIATVASLLLPYETKGREMQVSQFCRFFFFSSFGRLSQNFRSKCL
jgi:hypothetical protein